MTVFTGTTGADSFVGADFVADEFRFDPTTLGAADSFDGGLSATPGDYDSVVLAAGRYDAADFAGMAGIEEIVLDGPVTLALDSAMVDQGGTGGIQSWFVVRAGAGDDVVDASAVGITANLLAIVLGGGSDIAYGSADGDSFSIDPFLGGDHRMFGGGGNDDFWIDGVGSHVIDGEAGDADRLLLDGNVGPAELDLKAAGGQLVVDGGLTTASVAGVERFYATHYDDTLHGDAGDQEFWGLVGDDVLNGRGGDDLLAGDVGDDTLRGGNGDDALFGDGGTDTADYTGAADDLDIDLTRTVDQAVAGGATGVDQLHDIENVIGGGGDDVIAGDAGVNVIHGGAGNDILIGREGDDILYGNGGDDILDAGTGYGADLLDGGAGLDRADFGDATGDVFVDLVSMHGNDGLARSWTLLSIEGAIGGSGADSFWGDTNANRFQGGQGADDLHGLDGDDQLIGGRGADTLDGGSGDDLLVGGAGADLFVIADTGAGYGADTIQDFQDGVDTVEMHGVANVVVNDAGGDAFIDMFDATWGYFDTVRLVGAAGQIDAADYVLL